MAARLQRAHAFVGVVDGHLLRTEILAVELDLPAPGVAQRLPRAVRRHPGAVGPAGGVQTVLGRGAAQSLVAHVGRAARALRDEDVAHDAVLVDAERGAVDEETDTPGLPDR